MAAHPQTRSLLGRRGKLALDETLASLVVDGYLAADDAKQVRMGARSGRSAIELHPLVLIANAKLPNQREPGRPLSLENLTEWLAGAAKLAYLKIDPMKINAAAVTQVVSHAYAQRHRILPVAATPGEVTFATCEPFEEAWAADLSHMLRRDVRRVVSNPLDINRYLQEFYGVQRSIQMAQDAKSNGGYDTAAILNFEQLVELGKAGEVGADDRHVVHIVDWLLQYAFEQRASDIHLEPRREAGLIRFRIDGVMHKVFELPPPVMTAVTARIKILARMDVAEKRRPQDGRIKTRSSTGREVELRISNMPTAFGELLHWFDVCEITANQLVAANLPLPAYEQVMKASHTFNLLDARRAISVTERQRYILRVRNLSRAVAESYFAQREKLGFPGLKSAGAQQEVA